MDSLRAYGEQGQSVYIVVRGIPTMEDYDKDYNSALESPTILIVIRIH